MTTILTIICASAVLAAVVLAAWVWGWIAEQLEQDERGNHDRT